MFGLIESEWGGTLIEAWMPQEPLDLCGIAPSGDFISDDANRNSFLYNAMIHPLVRISIKGVLWYQGLCKKILCTYILDQNVRITTLNLSGESNGDWNRDKYLCAFPAMISELRKIWSKYTPTSDLFPFGFMQLSTWDANMKGPEFPMIRWHQTADFG